MGALPRVHSVATDATSNLERIKLSIEFIPEFAPVPSTLSMKSIVALPVLSAPYAHATECTDSDYRPLATSALACSTASGTTVSASSFSLANASVLCQYTDCQTFPTSLGALNCTISGESVSSAATICSTAATTTVAPDTTEGTADTSSSSDSSSGSSSANSSSSSSGSSSGSSTTDAPTPTMTTSDGSTSGSGSSVDDTPTPTTTETDSPSSDTSVVLPVALLVALQVDRFQTPLRRPVEVHRLKYESNDDCRTNDDCIFRCFCHCVVSRCSFSVLVALI
ncbi:hypothetical protein AeRB84_012644 [Aphanomyces euteiches]|nr:hypothetical protein AeRB84_012644 [Aphanomyces euteiches]